MGRRLQTVTKGYLAAWPVDFQQILIDLLFPYGEADSDKLDFVNVQIGDIRDHLYCWEPHTNRWQDEDRQRVKYYAERMLEGDEFPPLIADEPYGFLFDGYHRMGAYLKLKRYRVPFIYLNRQELNNGTANTN